MPVYLNAALEVFQYLSDEFHVIDALAVQLSLPEQHVAQALLFLLVYAGLGHHRNKSPGVGNLIDIADIKEGFRRSTPAVHQHHHRPRLIRRAAGRHILIPRPPETIQLHGMPTASKRHRLLVVAQIFLSLSSVPTGKSNIAPCLLQERLCQCRLPLCHTDLGNGLLVDIA